MKRKPDLKDREQALIDAALRELAARKSPAAGASQRAPTPTSTRTSTSKGAGAGTPNPNRNPTAPARRPAPSNPVSPIEHPTVDGWNHPAARDAAPSVKIAVEEKWARLAAVMETEQREAREARDRMRRTTRRFAIGATVVILLAVISFLR
jgi:hypothetical protein